MSSSTATSILPMNFSASRRSAFLPSSGSRFLSFTTATAFEPAHSRYSTCDHVIEAGGAQEPDAGRGAADVAHLAELSLGGIWLRIER